MEFASGHIHYPTSRQTAYTALLLISKILLTFCYFITYDLLKSVHVVHLLFACKSIASIVLILIQKPLSSGKKLTKNQWFRVVRHAFLSGCLQLLHLFGLSQCGPLRTILLSEHKPIVVVAGLAVLFTGTGGHSKLRGAACFLIGILSLFFLDHDERETLPTEHPEGQQHHGISHIFYYTVSWLGLVDHKAGVLLLVLLLCLETGFHSASRKLAVDIGGAKRLNALSSLCTSVLLAPWALFLRGQDNPQQFYPSSTWGLGLAGSLFLVSLVWYVFDYYVELVCSTRLSSPARSVRLGALATFFCALLPYVVPYIPVGPLLARFLGPGRPMDHALSSGVMFAWLMIILATIILTSGAGQSPRGKFVGYSANGTPLFISADTDHKSSSQSIVTIVLKGIHQILEEPNSRKIFYFLCLNVVFTFVEMTYGIWTNSLGLISDSFHMLFDCSALVMGLCASLLSRKKPSSTFPFGYGRVEVLSGFINGLFLVVISFIVFKEAISRLFDPQEIITSKLLPVSIGGLLINLLGILVFRHAHSHGHQHSHSSHSHNNHHHHSHNSNMQGVFLHILADTLGSVGVIVSSLLMEHFGWLMADALCSLFISVLIFISVLPLLRDTSSILLLRVPRGMESLIAMALNKVMKVEGMLSYRNQHFWQHSTSSLAGSLHVQVAPDASEQRIINEVSVIFKELGFSQFAVQVEKEGFFQHMSGLGNDRVNMLRTTANAHCQVKII